MNAFARLKAGLDEAVAIARGEAFAARVTFTLPTPPALNNLYANVPGKGRVKSKRYHEWINAAGWELKAQKPSRIAGPVNLILRFGKPDNRKRDLDGIAKAPIDLLVAHGVIDADDSSIVRRIVLEWADVPGLQIIVEAA